MPNVFVNGTLANANEVNENFDHLENQLKGTENDVFYLMMITEAGAMNYDGAYIDNHQYVVNQPINDVVKDLKSIDATITSILSYAIVPNTDKVRFFCEKTANVGILLDLDITDFTHTVLLNNINILVETGDANYPDTKAKYCSFDATYYYLATGIKKSDDSKRTRLYAQKRALSGGTIIDTKNNESYFTDIQNFRFFSERYQISSDSQIEFLFERYGWTSSDRTRIAISTAKMTAFNITLTSTIDHGNDAAFPRGYAIEERGFLNDGRVLYTIPIRKIGSSNDTEYVNVTLSDGTSILGISGGDARLFQVSANDNFSIISYRESDSRAYAKFISKDGTVTTTSYADRVYSIISLNEKSIAYRISPADFYIYDGVTLNKKTNTGQSEQIKERRHYTGGDATSSSGILFMVSGTSVQNIQNQELESNEITLDDPIVCKQISFINPTFFPDKHQLGLDYSYDFKIVFTDDSNNTYTTDSNAWLNFGSTKTITKFKVKTKGRGGVSMTIPNSLIPFRT